MKEKRILTAGLFLILVFTTVTCSSSDKPNKEMPRQKATVKLSVPIAGVWSLPSPGIFYVIDLEPENAKGTLTVELMGKTLRQHKFSIIDSEHIRIDGASRKTAYEFKGKYIDMKKVADVYLLADPPQTFQLNADKSDDRSLLIRGLVQLGAVDSPVGISRLSETERTILPFKNMEADLNLTYGNVVGSVSGDPSKSNFQKPIHPSGQVNNLKINGRLIVLVDPNLKDGMLQTRDFGSFKVIMMGTGEGQTAIFVTRSQIKMIAKWLETK
jgi:hypothetical protein